MSHSVDTLKKVEEQFPEMLYAFQKPKKKLSIAEKAYREFLVKEVLKKLVH